MKNKYLLTSSAFKGNVVFGFSGGILTLFENNSTMNEEQLKWLFTNFPFFKQKLDEITPKLKGSLKPLPMDISFNAFWGKYSKKINKKRCQPLFEKLTDLEKSELIMSVEPYLQFLRRNPTRGKMDPETYIKNESYTNNWNSI